MEPQPSIAVRTDGLTSTESSREVPRNEFVFPLCPLPVRDGPLTVTARSEICFGIGPWRESIVAAIPIDGMRRSTLGPGLLWEISEHEVSQASSSPVSSIWIETPSLFWLTESRTGKRTKRKKEEGKPAKKRRLLLVSLSPFLSSHGLSLVLLDSVKLRNPIKL